MEKEKLVSRVELSIDPANQLVQVLFHPPQLIPIGSGRSAAVFRLADDKSKVIKIFHENFAETAKQETTVYRKLGKTKYYAQMYEYGERFLVIDYIAGKTFYQCLIEGIFVPEEAVKEVDAAIAEAEEKGLHPSDIHLKNIILTDNGIKMIDVARFLQNKDNRQWEDLKKAYYKYYLHPSFPKKIPEKMLELIAAKYHKKQIRI